MVHLEGKTSNQNREPNPDIEQLFQDIDIDELFNTLAQWNRYLESDAPYFQKDSDKTSEPSP